jgi:hypothetical protein
MESVPALAWYIPNLIWRYRPTIILHRDHYKVVAIEPIPFPLHQKGIYDVSILNYLPPKF